MEVALKAVEWLDLTSKDNVLDIGSGVGKFCLLGAQAVHAKFTGVELRKEFVEIASSLVTKLKLPNAHFICSDIKEINFSDYSAFYFYNPFCEMLSETVLIDEQITFSRDKHREYEDFIFEQLETLPIGTKIITYCSPQFVLPVTYNLKDLYFEGTLSLWEKTEN